MGRAEAGSGALGNRAALAALNLHGCAALAALNLHRFVTKAFRDERDAAVMTSGVLLEQTLVIFLLGHVIQYDANVACTLPYLALFVPSVLLKGLTPGVGSF